MTHSAYRQMSCFCFSIPSPIPNATSSFLPTCSRDPFHYSTFTSNPSHILPFPSPSRIPSSSQQQQQQQQHPTPQISPKATAQKEQYDLTTENVETVLQEARQKLSTVFGYVEESSNVGITGKVQLVEIDGACVVVRLGGRFWHRRSDVVSCTFFFFPSHLCFVFLAQSFYFCFGKF